VERLKDAKGFFLVCFQECLSNAGSSLHIIKIQHLSRWDTYQSFRISSHNSCPAQGASPAFYRYPTWIYFGFLAIGLQLDTALNSLISGAWLAGKK